MEAVAFLTGRPIPSASATFQLRTEFPVVDPALEEVTPHARRGLANHKRVDTDFSRIILKVFKTKSTIS
jgi:hypothetical protein